MSVLKCGRIKACNLFSWLLISNSLPDDCAKQNQFSILPHYIQRSRYMVTNYVYALWPLCFISSGRWETLWGFFLKWSRSTTASIWVLPSDRNSPWPTHLWWLTWEQQFGRQPGGAPEICESRAVVWPCLLQHHASLPWVLESTQVVLFAWISCKPEQALICLKAIKWSCYSLKFCICCWKGQGHCSVCIEIHNW